MKKLFLLLLLPVLAVSCNRSQPVSNTQPPTNTITENQSTDKTSYVDTKYGFSVEFPKDWELKHEFSHQDGYFISKGKSRLAILPRGEFDYGLPFDAPTISSTIINNKTAQVRTWTLTDGSISVIYNFIDPIPNWIICKDDMKNCNRLDAYASNQDDLETIQKIISTIKFTN